MELEWLGGGDSPPGGSPALAAKLPWLQRAAAAGSAGSGGIAAGSSGGGSGRGGRKRGSTASGGEAAGSGNLSIPASAPFWGGPPPAAALWEAAAALAGVEGESWKLQAWLAALNASSANVLWLADMHRSCTRFQDLIGCKGGVFGRE